MGDVARGIEDTDPAKSTQLGGDLGAETAVGEPASQAWTLPLSICGGDAAPVATISATISRPRTRSSGR
jgi:hypothetical protein